MQTTSYDLELNFFRLSSRDFSFEIFRRELTQTETLPIGVRILPVAETKGDREVKANTEHKQFEVRLQPAEDFQSFRCHCWDNAHITSEVLGEALRTLAKKTELKEFIVEPKKSFYPELGFVLEEYSEGKEVFWLRPYTLRATGEFGYLADFRFEAHEGCTQYRRIQELSLSTKGGRPNPDFYADRYQKIIQFVRRYGSYLNAMILPDGTQVFVETQLRLLQGRTLSERVYVLGNGEEVNSVFQGLRRNPPLSVPPQDVEIAFIFREEDRSRSQELYRALRGDTFPTFAGMTKMFGVAFDKSNTTGMAVADFSAASINAAAKRLRSEFGGKTIVPVALVPFSRNSTPEETEGYLRAKHAFLMQGMPSQFVDRKKLADRDALKWSVSNIGLALFAKMGGQPWKVKPTTTSGLIVGIGQAHRYVNGSITRYFAYCVLTDTSGLYEKIHILASSFDESEYITSLQTRLREVLTEHAIKYKSFVIHATFSLRRADIQAINAVIEEVTEKQSGEREFAVLKFNDRNQFLAFSNRANSKVPFDSTVLRLSTSDYLVWFDGLNRANPTVRRPERPVHVKVAFPEVTLPEDTVRRLLQDAVNIAGTNWRGFNARSMPVSVYYAKLIADYYGKFSELGLPDIPLEDVSPWFL